MRVDAGFLDWLRPRVADSGIAQLDPYTDATLDAAAQQRWLATLHQQRALLRVEIDRSLQQSHRLPVAPAARRLVLAGLIDRDLSKHPWTGLLQEMILLLEISLEQAATIRLLGD